MAGWPALAEPARDIYKSLLKVRGQVAGLTAMFVERTFENGKHEVWMPGGHITLGARGDSYYEYLIKEYLAGGQQDQAFLDAYTAAMTGVREWLVGETAPAPQGGLLYIGEIESKAIEPDARLSKLTHLLDSQQKSSMFSSKMDHLVCFLPGALALGHLHGIETGAPSITVPRVVARDVLP